MLSRRDSEEHGSYEMILGLLRRFLMVRSLFILENSIYFHKEVYRISMKIVSALKVLLVVSVSFSLMVPGVLGGTRSSLLTTTEEPKVVSMISTQVELPAGSDYYIAFDSQNLTLKTQDSVPFSQGLSDSVIAAIAKAPRWIQAALTRQFHNMSSPESYATLLINASKQFADEIAFSIACCPSGKVPPAALLKENVESLYEHDQWLAYADIIDSDDGTGNYFSTIRYRILDNETDRYFTVPPEIYYWYVVHPKLTMAEIDDAYGVVWRDYLFNHNDLGYPLLKEKLSMIQYLWDNTSYYQGAYRLWTPSITEHPTAIEAISYWVGKTVPNQAIGDRPGKPSIIAHEHNGWCGELQAIATAAQRAALIPSIPACNVGEDHVWREFYERGWHENDNWWSDTGGAVDEPDVYAYGWGKNMSAIYTWRGDDTISDDTARYIHPQDRITATFTVRDSFLQPVDGARVLVLVKGPKDISSLKNLIWGKIQGIWDKLPDFLKGKILSYLFANLKERFNAIPSEITGVTITTWNYTDLNGRCSFQLGKNMEYLFLIQEGRLRAPWQLARHNTLRSLSSHTDKDFRIVLADISNKPQVTIKRALPSGDCRFTVSLSSTAYQVQSNFYTKGNGSQEIPGQIDCFFVDAKNFERYQAGKAFTCYNESTLEQDSFTVFTLPQDWFLVLRNHARLTTVRVNVSVQAAILTQQPCVQIVTPSTTLFAQPILNVGDLVTISGIATGQVTLTIDPDTYDITPIDGLWSFTWNTSSTLANQLYHITASSGSAVDSLDILALDAIPPQITIMSPSPCAIVERGVLMIAGESKDNDRIDSVEVRVDNDPWVSAQGTASWVYNYNLSEFSLGDHLLSAKAVDHQGTGAIQSIPFVINESGHQWGPQINELYHDPVNLTNTSNVIIYANVTTTGPFKLDHITLRYNDYYHGITHNIEMYRYGDTPMQSRHEEDPLKNLSNAPVYGKEIGQFPSGTTVDYWIIAVDTANNTRQSETFSFTVS